MKKCIGLIIAILILLTAAPGLMTTAQAGTATIENGVKEDGVYQLASGYSEVITVTESVYKPAITDSVFKTAQAGTVTIENGACEIKEDGVYQLASGYSGVITVAESVYEVTITDSLYQTKHFDTSIVVAGGRTAALELTIQDINITAPGTLPGIDFANAGSYDNKLYISGVCSVTGPVKKAGIRIPAGVKLSIDKVLSDETDQLTASSTMINDDDMGAGIGSSRLESYGDITISGGTIIANGASEAAGIGGNNYKAGGTITISGGTIIANGGERTPGIGGGSEGSTIRISGGNVTSTGGLVGSGICEAKGTITISGGTVTAIASIYYGAGITGRTITINGGTVTAYGGDGAAGIGGKRHCSSGDITISGGTVTAIGGDHGAGIGSADMIDPGVAGGTITISQEAGAQTKVTATGGINAAGIGGGCNGAGANVTIKGTPEVYATGNMGENIGKGYGGSNSGTLKDKQGDDLSYIKFYTGVPKVIIALVEYDQGNFVSSSVYETNAVGVFAGFIYDRSDDLRCQLSKAGYAAEVEWKDVSTFSNFSFNFYMQADKIPTNISKVTPLAIKAGVPLTVSFGKDYGKCGTLYLVPEAQEKYADKASLDKVSGGKTVYIEWNDIVHNPVTTGSIPTTDMPQGSYQVYLVDSAENLSAPVNITIDNTPPVIQAAKKAADETYIDLELSEGVYGPGGSILTKDRLQPVFAANGGIAAGASITAIKKIDNTVLKGGDIAIRVFIEVSGTSGGVETIQIIPSAAGSVCDKVGNAMSLEQPKGIVVLTDKQAPAVSNVSISTAKTTGIGTSLTWDKASDLGTAHAELEYCVYQSEADNINTIAEAEANGTVKQAYTADLSAIKVTGLKQSTTYYFNVLVKDKAGNKSCYAKVSVTTTTNIPPTITAADKAADDTYIDLEFSEEIYGEADGISALTKDKLQPVFIPNGGTAAGANITAVKKVDTAELEGGETAIRVYIEIIGTSSGVETVQIKPVNDSAIYDKAGDAMDGEQITGKLLLKDRQAPAVSNGSISVANTTVSGTSLAWNKASDLGTAVAELEYCVYQSAADNINTVADIEANGTVKQAYTADIAALNVTGLQAGNTYYFNVTVKDEAGNKSCYDKASVTTDANAQPTIAAANKAADDTYIDLEFSEGIYGAANGISALTKDKLQLVFIPNGGTAAGANITAVKKVDNTELMGGEAVIRVYIEIIGTSSGVETVQIKPVNDSAIYDEAGGAMNETQITGKLLLKDKQAPAVSNGSISIANTTVSGTSLAWNKASDLGTAAAELEYCVYQSAADNINTVADIEANGTVKQAYTADIAALNVTGLQAGTTYYFNVTVKDEAGNKSCYTKASVTTTAAPGGNTNNGSSGGGGGRAGSSTNATTTETTKSKEVRVPVIALTGAAGKAVEIKTELATIVLPSNMFTTEAAGNSKFTTITVNKADITKLSAELQAQLGNRPVIDITLMLDGKVTSWNNPNAPVTVTVPYKPTAEELANPENITVWYIDGAGKAVAVPSDRYDAATGTVSFTTTHFSKYAVVYVKKSFSDLANASWAKQQIEVLAAKGIMSGRTAAEFAPQAGITRAEYISALVRAMGLSAKVETNFKDVRTESICYNEIGIAKALGITSGVGDNSFKPEATITRQEMLVMTERALRNQKLISKIGTKEDLKQFKDNTELAAYSVNSIAALVKEGLIEGSGDKLNVGSDTTRAEAAVFLYRIYNRK